MQKGKPSKVSSCPYADSRPVGSYTQNSLNVPSQKTVPINGFRSRIKHFFFLARFTGIDVGFLSHCEKRVLPLLQNSHIDNTIQWRHWDAEGTIGAITESPATMPTFQRKENINKEEPICKAKSSIE